MYRQCTPYRDGFGQATLATKRTDCLNRADEGQPQKAPSSREALNHYVANPGP